MADIGAVSYNDGTGKMIFFRWSDGKRQFIVCPVCHRRTPLNTTGRKMPIFTKTKHDPGCVVGSRACSAEARRLHE